jgi:hypothetical protein
MIKLLRPNAAQYGVNRDQVEKEIEKEYLESADSNN